MGPTTNLSYLLDHLAGVIHKQSDQVLQEQLGIGFSQYKILMVMEWSPRIEQKSIADSLGQTEASVSRQISILRGKGLLTSRVDPSNRRKHITAPSPLGMQVTEAATYILRRNFGPEYASIGDDQLMQVINGLQRLHHVVCKPGKLGACGHQLGL